MKSKPTVIADDQTKPMSDVDKAFSEGTNALYIVLQMMCPECNKLVRVSLLTNEMSKVKP